MNNKFLYDLQKDILDKKGTYILYAFIFILSFIITIENIKLCFDIFIFIILTFICIYHFIKNLI